MDFASDYFGEVTTEALGWFLIHSIWLGATIAILLRIIIQLLRNRSAQLRYYASYAALLLIVFSTSYTFYKAFIHAKEKAQLKEIIINNPAYLSDQIRENYSGDRGDQTLSNRNSIRLERIKLKSSVQQYFPWIVSIWAIGLLLYLARVSGSLIYLFRIRTFRRIPFEPEWINKTLKYCSALKIKKRVCIYLSSRIKTPITIGYFKPVILVPFSLVSGLSPEMLEAVIAHELAHIRRNDYLLNFIQILIETLFFYHPGVWYVSSQIRHERELSCDDIALELTADKVNFAKALTLAQEILLNPNCLAPAFAAGKNNLLLRIKRLNTKITMKTNLFEKLAAGFILITAFLFYSFIIDGSNSMIKDNIASDNSLPDTLSNAGIVMMHKTVTDSGDHKKVVRYVQRADKDEIDSLVTALQVCCKPGNEMEKMIEILLCEPDIIDLEETMKNIHIALDEIDMEELAKEMEEAKREMAEQRVLLDCESLIDPEQFEDCDSLNKVIKVTVNEAMEIAHQELENLNIDSIVNQAMMEANQSIKDLDIDLIVADALEEARSAIEDEHIRIITIQNELKDKEVESSEQSVGLKEKEAELKQQLAELEKQLKELKKQQKEKSKKK